MKRIDQESARRLMGRLALRESAGNGNKSWYRIKAQSEAEVDIYLYDEISMWGVEAEQFVRDLNGITAQTINLRINSPGGDVFDGAAIFNALERHPAKVITHIDGLAASMASVIALAGDEVRMAENAFFMIHHPWCLCVGNAEDMKKTAEILEKIGDAAVRTYVRKSGQSEKQIRAWMDEETWMTADEAKEAGFVSEIVTGPAVESKFDLSIYSKVPDALKGKDPGEWSERDFEGFLRDAGFSRKQAEAVVCDGFRSLNQGDPGTDDLVASLKKNIEIMRGGTQ
jgi:ATP-dependent Clp endopeptidase proteolytic subunit ClpP